MGNAMAEEMAREHWIAHHAACRIAECVPLEQIDETELSALADWLSFELQDRSERNGHATVRGQ